VQRQWRVVSALADSGRFSVLDEDAYGQSVLELALGTGDGLAVRDWRNRAVVLNVITNQLQAELDRRAHLGDVDRTEWSTVQDGVIRALVAYPIHVVARPRCDHVWATRLRGVLLLHGRVFDDPGVPHVEGAVMAAVSEGAWMRRSFAVVVACWPV